MKLEWGQPMTKVSLRLSKDHVATQGFRPPLPMRRLDHMVSRGRARPWLSKQRLANLEETRWREAQTVFKSEHLRGDLVPFLPTFFKQIFERSYLFI